MPPTRELEFLGRKQVVPHRSLDYMTKAYIYDVIFDTVASKHNKDNQNFYFEVEFMGRRQPLRIEVEDGGGFIWIGRVLVYQSLKDSGYCGHMPTLAVWLGAAAVQELCP